jgi:hypothetical protein
LLDELMKKFTLLRNHQIMKVVFYRNYKIHL